jgi:enediyne biosynthesis protein E4
VHFGVGKSKKIDRVELLWPSGTIQVLENVDVNQVRRVEEPR